MSRPCRCPVALTLLPTGLERVQCRSFQFSSRNEPGDVLEVLVRQGLLIEAPVHTLLVPYLEVVRETDDLDLFLQPGLVPQDRTYQDTTLGVDLMSRALAVDPEHELADVGTEKEGPLAGDPRHLFPNGRGVG